MLQVLLLAGSLAVTLAAPQHQQQYNAQPRQPQQQYNAQSRQPQPVQPQQQQNVQPSSPRSTPPVPIVSLDNNVNHDGSYQYRYEGGDGTRAEQVGQLKAIGTETGEVSQGSYSYVGDDGRTYAISYTADETGYHPVGDHLPQPPPIPEAILKSLEYLATAPPFKDEYDTENNKNQ